MATPPSNLSETLNTTTMPSPPTQPKSSTKYTYYHAGPLFTIADLSTNVTLSRLIHTLSSQKFTPILPQDLEARSTHPHHIRDQDIRALLSCDLALFTYDGAELDAGTVVEYMVAKMADIPAVILRTDIRGGGDQGVGSGSGGDAGGAGVVANEGMGDSWNLMSSFWPRTRCVVVDSMVGYKRGLQTALAEGGEGAGGVMGKGNVKAGQGGDRGDGEDVCECVGGGGWEGGKVEEGVERGGV